MPVSITDFRLAWGPCLELGLGTYGKWYIYIAPDPIYHLCENTQQWLKLRKEIKIFGTYGKYT